MRSSPPSTDSATASVASLACASCDTANRHDRQYCASCGARLWEPCLKCGRSNAAAEKHCGACGVSLTDHLRHAASAAQAELAEAEKLAADSRHSEAIDRLLAFKIADHSALAELHEAKTERVAALRTEMLRCNRQRDQAIAEGSELLAACDYEQAALALEGVSEPYRIDELRQLLDQVRSRQVEMLTLAAEIRRAVAERRTDGLLPQVEELLRIKPDHSQARALAERLRPLEHKKKLQQRDALYQAAKANVARHEYAAAFEQLKQIPDDLRTPQLAGLIDDVKSKAAEVAWLSRDLRQAVVYDNQLLPIAERLAKLRPGDAEAASFVRKLAQAEAQFSQRALAPGSQRKPDASACRLISLTSHATLVEPPPTSHWGPPLETISSFEHIDVTSLDNDGFKSSPDSFCVAFGLALQGLGKALVNINLVPAEKAGLLGLLKSRRKLNTSAWGVDVGRAAIKALRLTVGADDRIVVDAVKHVEHSRILNAPETDAAVTLAETLDKLCAEGGLRDAPLCISLPAHKVLFRPIALPLVDEKTLAGLMQYEVRQQIPFPIEHVVWGYQLLGARQSEAAPVRECEVALCALRVEEAQAAIAPFTGRGHKVELLTSDAAALLNFVMLDREAAAPLGASSPRRKPGVEQPQDSGASLQPDSNLIPVTAILDVGTDTSNLILTDGASLVVRSIPLGGNSFSRTMVKEFQLTFAQAEKVKRNVTAVRELHRLYDALEPRFADLEHEAHRTIDGYLQNNPARRLARFLITGGGLNLHGALRRLWHGE